MKAETFKTLEKLIEDNAPRAEIESYVRDNFITSELVSEYVTLLINDLTREETPPIRMSEEAFRKHFRIIGTRTDGTEETRGRYKAKRNICQ